MYYNVFNGKVSERDGSHVGEVVLCWVLLEQARHEHMSDEYKNRYIVVVLLKSPSWVIQTNTRPPELVPSELIKVCKST